MLGGFLVGTLWLIVSISLTEWLSARGKIIWQIPGSAMQTYTVSLSIILVLLAALIYAEVYQFPLFEPYRVCRRPLFLRECPDEKSKIHP